MSAKGRLSEFFKDSKKNMETQLFEVQLQRLEHDEKYHKEIYSLSVQNRITHVCLNFAKYTGQISEIVCSEESIEGNDKLKRTIVDIFASVTILANILNTKLSDGIDEIEIKAFYSIKDLSLGLAKSENIEESDINGYLNWYLNSIAVANGKIAKACEKLNTLEAYPFQEEVRKGLVRVFKSTLIISSYLDYDLPLPYLAKKRLSEVAERSIFHEKLQ